MSFGIRRSNQESDLPNRIENLKTLVRSYPVAAFALVGLFVGGIAWLSRAPWYQYIFEAVAIGGGIPLAWATARNMSQGRYHVDTIATLAIIGSVFLHEYLAGALVVLMQSGGEALEDYGLRQANRSLDNLLKRAPSVAHRRRNGEMEEVRAADLVAGDTILIRPGDIIAADGIVSEGQGAVDESALTGEPVPLPKSLGDHVFSGTINLTGSFLVRTTSSAAESKYERIVRMVQQAQGERAPINRLANRYTPAFTLLTLAVAALAFAITFDTHRALSVLVVATPCPLIIATPLAVLSAINKAASLNVIVKSGAAIEQAGEVNAVVFDKTGTLTVGTPLLSEIRCFADANLVDSNTLLAVAAGVEVHSAHVLAGAVVRAARERNLQINPASELHETPGAGVSGMVDEMRVSIGSQNYLSGQGAVVDLRQREQHESLAVDGRAVAYVAIDGKPAGLLAFQDRIRPESPRLIERLRGLGIASPVMLTGDAEQTARSVGEQIGIRDVRAHLQPEDKVEAIRQFAATSNVMMVGDGINDAPALAVASIGVAMGGYGAGIATDAADMVITVENVERVADIIVLGRRMVTIAKQSIFFGIGASTFLMIVASFGYIPPPVGAMLQEALDVATILNALRAR